MKLIGLFVVTITLITGCAQNRGGTGNGTDNYRGYGESRTPTEVNDTGWLNQPKNIRPNGQPRVPDRAIDIVNEPQ